MAGRKIGAIDLGSNSLRLLLAFADGRQLLPLRSELVETRLGQKLQPGRPLYPPARARTLAALVRLFQLMEQEGVEAGEVVATSAVREAADGSAFLQETAALSPYPVRLLTAGEEAYYGFRGALHGTGTAVGAEKILVLDFGGRSSEFSWQQGENFCYCSLPFGAVGLNEAFSAGPGQGAKAAALLRQHIKELLERQEALMAAVPFRELVGLGGTVTTLAMLAHGLQRFETGCVHGLSLSSPVLRNLAELLRNCTPAERARLLPFAPQRADIIVAGAAALLVLLEQLNKDGLIVSENGLLHGLLLEFMNIYS